MNQDQFKLPFGWTAVPLQPSNAHLMSMAIRSDHGLGCEGFYDSELFKASGITHQQRVDGAISSMRQLYEEAIGEGFYKISENQPVNLPDQLTCYFKENEMEVIKQLCDEQEMTGNNVLRQALRLYQLVYEKNKKGFQMGFFDANGQREQEQIMLPLDHAE